MLSYFHLFLISPFYVPSLYFPIFTLFHPSIPPPPSLTLPAIRLPTLPHHSNLAITPVFYSSIPPLKPFIIFFFLNFTSFHLGTLQHHFNFHFSTFQQPPTLNSLHTQPTILLKHHLLQPTFSNSNLFTSITLSKYL